MVKTRSTTRNQNHDNDDASSSSSSRKRFKTFDNDGVAPWSDVDHDVLSLVMMQLGVVDFIAFSGVCNSWRSLALSNRKTFMASKPPMKICNYTMANKDDYCYLEDFERRKFKTILPHFIGRICVGSTCGYLILFGRGTRDFWLVNLITRHELHFPDYPIYVGAGRELFRGILVFSPSISGWVFVLLHDTQFYKRKLSFSVAGKRGWNHVSFTLDAPRVCDLHVFKGKIYTLHTDSSLCELRLNLKQKRKWTLLETINFPNPNLPQFQSLLVSSGENLYVMMTHYGLQSKKSNVLELNFCEMKWVSPEKSMGEYAFFISYDNYSAAIKPESLVGPWTRDKSYDYFFDADKSRKCMFYYERMWYFPLDCLNVNLLDE